MASWLLLAASASAFPVEPDMLPRFAADAREFGIRLILVGDRDAFLRMGEAGDAQHPTDDVGRRGHAGLRGRVVLGGPRADGNCDLVYTMSVRDAGDGTVSTSGEQRLCGGHPPRPRQELVLGDTIAGFTTGKENAKLVVSLNVVDRATGATLTASAPLEVVKSWFHLELVQTLDEMSALIRTRFAIGAPRDDLRKTFVEQGHATLKTHPTEPGVEKYLYDFKLCSYYVWRWNISADYDEARRLRQAYVNGEPVFADGTPKQSAPRKGAGGNASTITKGERLRPEAYKGARSRSRFEDAPRSFPDRGRPDPLDMGKLHVYGDVDPWRSIFDSDAADRIVDYSGNCAAVDAKISGMKGKSVP